MQNPQHENVVPVHTVEDDVPRVIHVAALRTRFEVSRMDALSKIDPLVASGAQRRGPDIGKGARDQIGVPTLCGSAEPKGAVL